MTDYDAAYGFVDAALRSALVAAGISVGVYADMADDGTQPPYVVYGASTSLDTNTNGDVRVLSELPFTVRATLQGNVSTGAVGDAIEAALGAVRQSPMNGFLFNSKRVGALSSLSPMMGRKYRYAGGRYMVTVRSIS